VSQNPTSLEDSFIKALPFEDTLITVKNTTNGIVNGAEAATTYIKGVSKPFYCHYCGKEGHNVNKCYKKSADIKKEIKQPVSSPSNSKNSRNYNNNSNKNNNYNNDNNSKSYNSQNHDNKSFIKNQSKDKVLTHN